jgi:hypothetical protein
MLFGGDTTAPTRRLKGLGWLLGVAVAVTLLALAERASAQTPPSAIDQYVEDPPDAGGTTSAGRPTSSTKLPPRVSSEVESQAGSDAPLLSSVATSSQYGAPQRRLANGGSDRGRSVRGEDLAAADPQADVSAGEALSAAAGAVQGGESLRIVALLAGMLVITLVALVTAALRVRRRAS